MSDDRFFTAQHCARCGGSLSPGRTMSWFKDETICTACAEAEQQLRERLPNRGRDLEGCGYLPQVFEEDGDAHGG